MRYAATSPVQGLMEVARREKRNGRRLAAEDVYEARAMALAGGTHSLLASHFGVSQSAMTRAINGDSYRDVPHPLLVPGRSDLEGGGWACYSYDARSPWLSC